MSSSLEEIQVSIVKRGRRTYGGIYTLPDKRRVYLAYRRLKEIFRSGEMSIVEAIRQGKAAWALDEETLLMLRAQGVVYAGVLVRETQDIFLTRTEAFFDKTKVKIMNYERRGGALQRYLPLKFFRRRPGKTRI